MFRDMCVNVPIHVCVFYFNLQFQYTALINVVRVSALGAVDHRSTLCRAISMVLVA